MSNFQSNNLRSRELYLEARLHEVQQLQFSTNDEVELEKLKSEQRQVEVDLSSVRLSLYNDRKDKVPYVD